MKCRVKNWSEFQHYKDRKPVWIKLHRDLLDDFQFQSLPVASRALAPMLWLLASQEDDQSVDVSPEYLSFRLRMTPSEAEKAVTPLIDKGFLIPVADCYQDASKLVQNASLETETETETETDISPDFAEFWEAYPRKEGKQNAERAWRRLSHGERVQAIEDAPQRFRGVEKQFIPHGPTYLNGKRWEDDMPPKDVGSSGSGPKNDIWKGVII